MFTEYINKLDILVKEAINQSDLAAINLEGLRKRNEKIQADPTAHAVKKTAEDFAYRQAVAEYKETVLNIRDELNAKAAELRKELVEEQMSFLAADPSAVDQNTVMLLNSGVLTDSDLVVMARRFGDNVTMLKLLRAEAEKHRDDSRAARVVATAIADYLSPDARLEVFDAATRVGAKTIDTRESLAGAFQREWETNFRDSFRSTMSKYERFSEVI